jgi:hypothetical protein
MCAVVPEVFDVPRYLFRTFDDTSSGGSDTVAVTSVTSKGNSRLARRDLLSMQDKSALEIIHRHVNRECFVHSLGSDNPMSWTSSILIAIQYAIWRAHMRDRSLSDTTVCAIDTRAFPKGQFVLDQHLLKIFDAIGNIHFRPTEARFFRSRIKGKTYYNREYFSQGHLEHVGRSCVTTLHDILTAGLFHLYPEFEDPKGRDKWTIRVWELRGLWWQAVSTSDEEIEWAKEIARMCFPRFDTTEVASILLTFRYRKPAWPASKGQFQCFVTLLAMFADNVLVCRRRSGSQAGRTTTVGRKATGSPQILVDPAPASASGSLHKQDDRSCTSTRAERGAAEGLPV